MRHPKVVWLLFDISNGQYPHRNYVWWFTTRRAAREHREWQYTRPDHAKLSQPVKYVLSEAV